MSRHLVFVIDPHPIISFGLVEMIKDIAPLVNVKQFATLREAAGYAVTESPDLLITDFYLKDVNSSNFIGLMETLMPGIPVLISALDDRVMAELRHHNKPRFTAFSKLSPYPKLMEYLRAGLVSAGIEPATPTRMPGTVVRKHSGQSTIGLGGESKPLTHKQVEVLEQIALGLSNKEISDRLQISVETVKGHVRDILDRLGVKNRIEASVFYRQALRMQQYEHAEH
ncbi:response regulator transcription factor [Limnobacter sp.]|uniref:response regulator transcription factor n=1 Tax=Limnobacter sp. TaxID=2003368 RepID=UPI00258577AA|nr:response regulator transcription factor [Limnobacter sp.]HEX5484609.1 response regulator transcription factor [Limnobacter sp.]